VVLMLPAEGQGYSKYCFSLASVVATWERVVSETDHWKAGEAERMPASPTSMSWGSTRAPKKRDENRKVR